MTTTPERRQASPPRSTSGAWGNGAADGTPALSLSEWLGAQHQPADASLVPAAPEPDSTGSGTWAALIAAAAAADGAALTTTTTTTRRAVAPLTLGNTLRLPPPRSRAGATHPMSSSAAAAREALARMTAATAAGVGAPPPHPLVAVAPLAPLTLVTPAALSRLLADPYVHDDATMSALLHAIYERYCRFGERRRSGVAAAAAGVGSSRGGGGSAGQAPDGLLAAPTRLSNGQFTRFCIDAGMVREAGGGAAPMLPLVALSRGQVSVVFREAVAQQTTVAVPAAPLATIAPGRPPWSTIHSWEAAPPATTGNRAAAPSTGMDSCAAFLSALERVAAHAVTPRTCRAVVEGITATMGGGGGGEVVDAAATQSPPLALPLPPPHQLALRLVVAAHVSPLAARLGIDPHTLLSQRRHSEVVRGGQGGGEDVGVAVPATWSGEAGGGGGELGSAVASASAVTTSSSSTADSSGRRRRSGVAGIGIIAASGGIRARSYATQASSKRQVNSALLLAMLAGANTATELPAPHPIAATSTAELKYASPPVLPPAARLGPAHLGSTGPPSGAGGGWRHSLTPQPVDAAVAATHGRFHAYELATGGGGGGSSGGGRAGVVAALTTPIPSVVGGSPSLLSSALRSLQTDYFSPPPQQQP